jgi:alpha-D-ribose 1-methylphosphonate 5-triphosphate diphosphatase
VTQAAQIQASREQAAKIEAAKPLILSNARLVLADSVIKNGWLACLDGVIAEIGEGVSPEASLDLGGHLLTPGLVELHTDHIESHYVPRPGVYWDPLAAVISYDAQLATSGITTVLDSLRIWREEGLEAMSGEAMLLASTIARARGADLLRADHFLHLRCEVPMPHTVEEASELIDRDDVRLLSLMDHTPGQRQFRDEAKLRAYYRGKTGGRTDAELDALLDRRREYSALHAGPNYSRLVEMAQARRLPLASHDDTTLDHVSQSIADGVALAEFPTTVEAAHALHDGAVKVLMGAPNLVRGGSHSGNVSTAELAHAGVLDILSSDYVPASLLMAALQLPGVASGFTLPAAFATVSKTPAEAVGLTDRGEIAVGKRADLLQIQIAGTMPVIRSVWRAGRRVA